MEHFEQWLNESKSQFDDNIIGLFSDSLKCFKNDIIRPAYLLAYQGMMVHLKSVILKGPKPDAFGDGEWSNICNKLNKDSGWDEQVFTCVKQEGTAVNPKQVFLMPSNIRHQFDYWRDLRNVCAHYKDYRFIKAHTLTLYSFISDTLLKITIEGGMQSLLRDFEIFFDPTYTSSSEPIQPLLDKISKMVRKEEMNDFLTALLKITKRGRIRNTQLFHLLLHLPELKDFIVDFLKKEDLEDLKLNIIDFDPAEVLTLVDSNPQSIRHFIRCEMQWRSNYFSIIAELLEAQRITKNAIRETFEFMLEQEFNHSFLSIVSADKDTCDSLKRHGYFECFISNYLCAAYTTAHYVKICNKVSFHMNHLRLIGITDSLVKSLCAVFSEGYYPYSLANAIKLDFLDGDSNLRGIFEAKCTQLGLEVPKCLKKKVQEEN